MYFVLQNVYDEDYYVDEKEDIEKPVFSDSEEILGRYACNYFMPLKICFISLPEDTSKL